MSFKMPDVWKWKLLGGLGLAGSAVLGLVYFQFSTQGRYWEAERLYHAGNTPQAQVKLTQLLQSQAPPVQAQLLMGEILLQEGELESAELQLNPAIQTFQQAVHNGKRSAIPHLAWAFYLKGLIRLAPAIQARDPDVLDWDMLKPWIQNAQDSLEQAFTLEPNNPRFDAAREVLKAVKGQETISREAELQMMMRLHRFGQKEPLYQRLAPVEPEVSPVASALPESQLPVRESIKRWQNIKSKAFVNQEISELKEVLTGEALQETISAVQWWKQSSNGIYSGLELKSLRFLKIQYRDPEHCQVVAEVDEMRNNSEEGQVNSHYRVRYELLKIAEVWYISSIQVEDPQATPKP